MPGATRSWKAGRRCFPRAFGGRTILLTLWFGTSAHVCYGNPRKLTPPQICFSPSLQMMAALTFQLKPKTLRWGRGSNPWPLSSHLICQQILFLYLQNIPWTQLFLIISIATVIISCLPYYKNLLTHLPALIISYYSSFSTEQQEKDFKNQIRSWRFSI